MIIYENLNYIKFDKNGNLSIAPFLPFRIRCILGDQPAGGGFVGTRDSAGGAHILDGWAALSVQLGVFRCGDVDGLLLRCEQLVAEDDQLVGIVHKGQRDTWDIIHLGIVGIPALGPLEVLGPFEVGQKLIQIFLVCLQNGPVGAEYDHTVYFLNHSKFHFFTPLMKGNAMDIDVEELKSIKAKIRTLDLKYQKEKLDQISPYSKDITSFIRTSDELKLYISLQLRESYLTRPALVADIDPELWVESEKATNLELMAKGRAPYAYDAPEGRIDLHHIGQDYAAPFAELTQEQHEQRSRLLHSSGEPSWRNQKKQERAFHAERTSYWIKRSKGEYTIDEYPALADAEGAVSPRQEYQAQLREICEEIYRQSESDDLDYLADLAKSYATMRRIGAVTIGEFLKNERDAQQQEVRCTACAASDYVHYGTYQSQGERVQRYKCKSCGNIFTATQKTLFSGSSFSFRDWIKFIDCLYNGFTLGQIAKACDISERTAQENRIKLFYALKLLNDKVTLQGNIVIDETYVPVSFKGNHSKEDSFVMPRKPHKRGGENHRKGITNDHACIVCAIDETGNSVCQVAGTGNPSAAKLKYVLQPHMGADIACLYSDKSSAIKSYAEKCGYEIKQEKQLRKGTKIATNVTFTRETRVINRYIQIANSYHSRLKRFLRRFSGISTKYLSGYLYLFAWKERSKELSPIEAYKELLRVMADPAHYKTTEEILNSGHLPDAAKINGDYLKKKYVPSEEDLQILEQYMSGRTMTSIAKDFHTTKQNISLKIQKLHKAGYETSLLRDIPEEESTRLIPHKRLKRKVLDTLIRDYQIYDAKQKWTGTPDEFNLAMSQKYGIAVQRVRNVVALVKRYIRLKEEMYIYEDISYQSLKEVYRNVYSDYLELNAGNPEITLSECVQRLAAQYGYKEGNIKRILHIMSTNPPEEYFQNKRKFSTTETYNRDKALFIDFLRWNGERGDFCRYAQKKYGLSFGHVEMILKYCLYADPKRFNMV